VEHFGDAGFQPRTFSRSQDHDGELFVGHKFQPILREQRPFRNAGMQLTRRMPNQQQGREKGQPGRLRLLRRGRPHPW
jgi:hypothetical protein